MKEIDTNNEDLEFGLIDNEGSFNLLDDEENNSFDNYSDDGMSFESLIGEATNSENINDSRYSTAELNDLEDVINMVGNSDDSFELDSVDAKTMDLNDLGLDKIENEETDVEPVEITDNTVSLDDLNLEDNIDVDDITIDEDVPTEEEVITEEPVEEEAEVEPVEETEEVEEEISEEVPEEVEETIEEENVPEEEPEVVEETIEEEVPAEEPVEEKEYTVDITSDLANLEESLNDEDSPLNIETANLEDEIQVSDDYNIDDLFDKASKGAKEASNIFSQNLELRKQIDEKYNRLVKLSEEQESAKKQALTEIEDYKNEVYLKLKEQKTDVENKIEELKQLQATFEAEKNEFVQYRNQEIEAINAAKQEIEQQRSAIAIIEEKLIARKNNVDAERTKIKEEREQFEVEKKNLRANLKKFNELVGGFTNGIDQVTNQNNEGNQ